jgi:hypothetical protein
MSGSVAPERDPVTGQHVVLTKPFAASDGFRFRGKGIAGTAIAGAVTNIDYTLPAERWLNGAELILKNHVIGDKVDFQVVHPDGVTVLDNFGEDWYVSEDQAQSPVILSYPAKIPQGIIIRVKYTSTGQANVIVKCNLLLHWKAV